MGRTTMAASACVLAAAAALVAAAAGCNPNGGGGRGAESPQTGLPTTTMRIGNRTFTLEIASTDNAREKGLMYRDSMPADHGMIFLFRQEQTLSFWMKHTHIPLDIIYLDKDGRVVSIHPMQPLDLTGITAKGPAKYAIELNQGAAAACGVKEGDQLQIPADVAAIKADATLAP